MGLATALPSAAIRSGRRCIDFEQSAHSAQLKFATGETDIADVVIGADGIQSSLQKHVVEPSTPEYSGSRAPGFDSDGKGSGMAKRGASDLDGRWEALHGLSGPEWSTFQRVGAIIFRHLVGKLFMAWQPNGSFRQRGQCLVKVEGQLPVDSNVSCQLSLFFEDSYVSLKFVNGVLERDEFEPEVCFHDEPHGWMLSAMCAALRIRGVAVGKAHALGGRVSGAYPCMPTVRERLNISKAL
jgi:hypothetical protein